MTGEQRSHGAERAPCEIGRPGKPASSTGPYAGVGSPVKIVGIAIAHPLWQFVSHRLGTWAVPCVSVVPVGLGLGTTSYLGGASAGAFLPIASIVIATSLPTANPL